MLANQKENNKTDTFSGALKKGMANISVLVAVTRNNTPIMAKLKTNKARDEWRRLEIVQKINEQSKQHGFLKISRDIN